MSVKVFQVDRLKLAMANLDHRRYRVMIGGSWCGDRWVTRLGQAARVEPLKHVSAEFDGDVTVSY